MLIAKEALNDFFQEIETNTDFEFINAKTGDHYAFRRESFHEVSTLPCACPLGYISVHDAIEKYSRWGFTCVDWELEINGETSYVCSYSPDDIIANLMLSLEPDQFIMSETDMMVPDIIEIKHIIAKIDRSVTHHVRTKFVGKLK